MFSRTIPAVALASLVAAAPACAAIQLNGPAVNAISINSLTYNGLSAHGALADLNGVTIEGVALPAQPGR